MVYRCIWHAHLHMQMESPTGWWGFSWLVHMCSLPCCLALFMAMWCKAMVAKPAEHQQWRTRHLKQQEGFSSRPDDGQTIEHAVPAYQANSSAIFIRMHRSWQFTELCWRVQFRELIIGFIPLRKQQCRLKAHRQQTDVWLPRARTNVPGLQPRCLLQDCVLFQSRRRDSLCWWQASCMLWWQQRRGSRVMMGFSLCSVTKTNLCLDFDSGVVRC